MSRRTLVVAVALCATLLLGACSGDEDGASDASIVPTTEPPIIPCAPATDIPEAEGKPEIETPPESVRELQIEDVVVGTGTELTVAEQATINFVGISCSNGLQFDSTWDSGEPLVLAGLQLPPAFEQGLVGMKVGGLRRLVVPHDLGYGPIGRGGVLPYETLVFMVELVDVTDPLQSVAGQPCVPPTNIPQVEGKPAFSYEAGPAPTELAATDLVEGTGDEVTVASTVTMNYLIIACTTGLQWDSTWDRGEPVTVPVVQLQPGAQAGVIGMREGGQRVVEIPSDQAYGANPPAQSPIAPDESLIYVVEVLAVENPAGTDGG